ncbi:glucose 1-dehydrogenase [Glaciibacter psychrotolerans]|uniref:3alpha(Or 20beta)-hydroxysteroid dehydrogenase n=1 Tax=Glaciibacter psychrotolerans TaxID=670054 RepID=A0A7Z0EFW9_9MICO|nr:glucose 1-dehydrogenase [Leifsonia psychrotolerans]NYJ20928.1 3alpha(or 20beta)-hydroxysteroid dehydrogenase [Leifsonia psychrotolerans]
MGRLDNKVALISGGARGMGATHARAFVAEGARVVLGDLLDAEGEALAAELGDAAAYIHLDVTKPDDWKAAVEFTVAHFGSLTVLVNNAGIANGAPITTFPLELWQKTLDINLTGVFNGIQAATPALVAAGPGGSIINISSVEGLRGSAGLHAYVASKFAVRGLTKSVALDLGQYGIRVNSVHPGFIETEMTKAYDAAQFQIPLARGGAPEEVSKMVLFLASDDSSYSTGAEFVVDGGMIVGIPHA